VVIKFIWKEGEKSIWIDEVKRRSGEGRVGRRIN